MKLCKNEIINMSLAWNKDNIWVPNKMHRYDLPYTRLALSIHFELLRTHKDRGHILYIKYIFFFSRYWRFENIHFSARCRTINSCTDWKWLAENINKCVERMAVRGGLSPPPGPMNQIHYCHSIVKHTSLDSINKLIIQLKNESLSRSLL